MAAHHQELMHKSTAFQWQQKHDEAFVNLKTALASSTSLGYPNADSTMVLDKDASNDAIGAKLVQIQS